jgi:hypothetical protein
MNRRNDFMSCEFSQESISGYFDNRLTEPERNRVAVHLQACRECAATHESTVRLRSALRSLPVARASLRLKIELQILASNELVRRRRMSRIPALAECLDRVQLLFDNLMRPLALPFAGGLASALFMFVMLLPGLGVLRDKAPDTPSPLYTEASVGNLDSFASGSKASDDTVVEVQIDGQGHMVDYNVLEGTMTGDFGNLLLFATFTPATVFLQPTSGKVVIRRSRIVVKG